jgi:hypothetical protein
MNTFTVQVSDGSATDTAALQVTVADINDDANGNGILDDWELAHFGNADPGANAADDDPDDDGDSNLMEFALNTNPLRANPSPLVRDLEDVAGARHLRLTLPKNPAATNLIYTVQSCGDLVSWTHADTSIETDTATQLIVRDNSDVAVTPRRFIRLRVAAIVAPSAASSEP